MGQNDSDGRGEKWPSRKKGPLEQRPGSATFQPEWDKGNGPLLSAGFWEIVPSKP